MAESLHRHPAVVATCSCGGLTAGYPSPGPGREALKHLEALKQTGGHVMLTDAETHLDALMLKMKQEEVSREQNYSSRNTPIWGHFFRPGTSSAPVPI
ncbi:hypothetical protein PBY51_012248 [Eleginops maclovinus]|uniref:Adenosine/AMP deaminase N-terminal domain-containing protein n=1 Tax=Eleginops maclovinus TaxID=56733 RepID=A0AAN7XSX5_ELEMC|nr:hypothetical protein PBY51_012248 [Eleginops maclovinus]